MKEFLIALLGGRGDLDAWLECNTEQECRDVIIPIIQQRDELLAALKEIAAIKNKMDGGDWDEIEKARNIAKEAIAKCKS